MGKRTCSVATCDEKHVGLGYCSKHWKRFRKSGSTAAPVTPTAEERFWSKVDASGDCWEWTAGGANGYGHFFLGKDSGSPSIKMNAHRWAYQHLVGPIPDDFQLDHLCKNRACVNPDHLEPVPAAVNLSRSGARFFNLQKTQCPRGHPYSGDNLIRQARGGRACRECMRACWRNYKRRVRGSAA